MKLTALMLIAAGLLVCATAFAQDRADIDRTQIIGNRELPKALYITTWKKPLAGDLSPPLIDGVMNEALAPIDRDVFRRQLRFDAQAQSSAKATPAPAPPVK